MNLMRGIDLAKIAEKLPGASGAEIKAVCTEAGMYALRERRVHVTQEDFEMAVAKVRHSTWFVCVCRDKAAEAALRSHQWLWLTPSSHFRLAGYGQGQREEHVSQETVQVKPRR